MKTHHLLLVSGLFFLAAGCKKDAEHSSPAATGDGTVTWTTNGTTYTSTLRSSAIVDTGDKIIITGGSDDSNNIVSLGLLGISVKGAGVYQLSKGSVLDGFSSGALTLNGSNVSQGTTFNTLYGQASSNGTITVSEYNKTSQKLSGTFTFTAGAVPNTPAAGYRTVTSGSFSFTKFR